MDAILRAAAVYLLLLIVFRIAGRRSLAQMTSFDFVLLLVIGESTSDALIGDDYSVTRTSLVIITLIVIDIGLSLIKGESSTFSKLLDGTPMVIVEHGKLLRERMRRARVDEEDVLEAARKKQGIESLDQIKYAVLEIDGAISIIPTSSAGPADGGKPASDAGSG